MVSHILNLLYFQDLEICCIFRAILSEAVVHSESKRTRPGEGGTAESASAAMARKRKLMAQLELCGLDKELVACWFHVVPRRAESHN